MRRFSKISVVSSFFKSYYTSSFLSTGFCGDFSSYSPVTMSSRALRRLERSKGMSSETEVSDSGQFEHSPVRKANTFSLLNGSEESEGESELEPYENDKQTEQKVEVKPEKVEVMKHKPPRDKSRGQKKKQIVENHEDDDDLDKYLEQVRKRDLEKLAKNSQLFSYESDHDGEDPELQFTESDPPITYTDANYLFFSTERLKECMHLLSIGTVKNLDPDTELKNLFGNLSLETIEDANSTSSLAVSPDALAHFKKLARLTRGWGGKDHRSVPGTSRKLLLTRIKDDWLPTAQKMLQMEDLTTQEAVETKYYKEEDAEYYIIELKVKSEEKLGIRYFQFSKLPNIQDRITNARFYASVVITSNPGALMTIFQQNPYHVENLLQLAMVMKRQGDNKATSTALVEKALFVFDRCFNKRFHELLQNGHTELVRLPYERFTNRQFYLTLFRLIVAHGERSTFFTALNCCKFLLALSPAEDPLGVRYFIDHYAILSEEYKYLLELVDSLLVQTYSQWFTPGLAFSKVLALLHLNRLSDAQTALKRAVDAHPFCACEMLDRVGNTGRVPMNLSDFGASDAVVLAAETYLVRASLLWKEPSHIEFFHSETITVLKQKRSNKSWFSKWLGTHERAHEDIPVNLLRFVFLSGENKVLAKVPPKIFELEYTNEYDVFPPRDSSVRYDVFKGQSKRSVTDHLLDYVDQNLLGAVVAEDTALFEDFQDEELAPQQI